MSAKVGSEIYGIESNKFLHKTGNSTKYILDVTILDDDTFSYQQDTQVMFSNNEGVFHHTDQNTLKKVG